jgi:hypothetical protein
MLLLYHSGRSAVSISSLANGACGLQRRQDKDGIRLEIEAPTTCGECAGRCILSQNDAPTAWAIMGFDNLSLVASESVCCGVLEGGRSSPADLAGGFAHARFAN